MKKLSQPVRACLPLFLLLAGLTACATRPKSISPHSTAIAFDTLIARNPQIKGEFVDSYLSGIKTRLTNVAVRKRGITLNQIVLLDAREPFAYSSPEAKVAVSSALVRDLSNEAEFAFVIAHEMAHDSLGHLETDLSSLDREGRIDLEYQADELALGIIATAGYDPRAAIGAIMHAWRSISSDTLLTSRDYPKPEERAAFIKNQISASGWQPPGVINRREFKILKSQL